MDVTEVQKIIGDQYPTESIETLIPILTEFAEARCGTQFDNPLPGGVKLFIAKSCEYILTTNIGLEARTLGDASFNFETDVPKSLHRYLKPYRKVRMP